MSALRGHEQMVHHIIENSDELERRLTIAHVKLEHTNSKLLELKHQLYDLRQLSIRVSNRLNNWEKRNSTAPAEEELAETRRFIASVGGMLRDGAQEAVEAFRARNPDWNVDSE
jgi:chromosome segregation ATPase